MGKIYERFKDKARYSLAKVPDVDTETMAALSRIRLENMAYRAFQPHKSHLEIATDSLKQTMKWMGY
jgi:hypothetical protein